MYHSHVRNIKIHFTIVLLWLITVVGGAAIFLRPAVRGSELHPYLTERYLQKQIDYLTYVEQAQNTADPVTVISQEVRRFFSKKSPAVLPVSVSSSTTAVSVPVLVYHGIVQKPDGNNILKEDFAAQLFALKQAGYRTISLADFAAYMKGEKSVPEKSFLITFDDGRKDSYYEADPVLKALGYRAVMFVITGHSVSTTQDSGYYLSLGELRQMKSTGRWDIDLHTHDSHDKIHVDEHGTLKPMLAHKQWFPDQGRYETDQEYADRIHNDMKEGKRLLKEKLDIDSIGFAYPFGDFGQDEFPAIRQTLLSATRNEFAMAFYQARSGDFFKQNVPDQSAFLIRRIEVEFDMTPAALIRTLEKTRAQPLPYVDDFTHDRGWQGDWGDFEIKDGRMRLYSQATSTGAMTVYGPGTVWSNYTAEADLLVTKGQSFTIAGAYRDNQNYIACRMSEHQMVLEEIVNGTPRVLRVWRGVFPVLKSGSIRVGIRVSDSGRAACILRDRIVLESDRVSNHLKTGAVGFTTWAPVNGEAELVVTRVSVTSLPDAFASNKTQ